MTRHVVSWFKLIGFAFNHSVRDLWRNRSRSLFALICIAAGVAAVVALRSLAFMVGDELTTNLAQLNRGDIRLYASRGVPELVTLADQANTVFTQETVNAVRAWADEEGYAVTMARLTSISTIVPLVDGQAVTAQPVVPLYVEPDLYPFYDTVRMRYPHNASLAEVFSQTAQEDTGTNSGQPLLPIVISNNLSREAGLGLQIGDRVRLGSSENVYEVAGIAAAEAETILTNPSAAFFGDYVYLPLDELAIRGVDPLPDQIFVRVPLGQDIAAAEASLLSYLARATRAKTNLAEQLNRASVPELEKQNADIANVIDDLILTLGLTSLLIGGIGIVNTMLVVVNRRMLEIAVLKTLGLKGYKVTFVFLVEAGLMGLGGSVVGALLGIGLSILIRDIGEQAFGISLEWRLYPVAIGSGLLLGMLITVLFGFLPTLIAGQVRPAIVLRPNEAEMPAAGLLQTLVTLVMMIITLGVLVSAIVEGAIDFGPVYMVVGGGVLVGFFAGVIVANMGVGDPIPAYYVFRLPRRFERLETWLLRLASSMTFWVPAPHLTPITVLERARTIITRVLRGLRQLLLAYGGVSIGLVLSSGIMLIVSELWLSLGLGEVKPANDVVAAVQAADWSWLLAWFALVLILSVFIRFALRTVASVLALATIGASVGGLLGLASGMLLERLAANTGIWNVLAELSTGVVLVEGALVLLVAIYVLYWLLVWALGRLNPTLLIGMISSTALVIMSLVGYGMALIGAALIVIVIGLAGGLYAGGRVIDRRATATWMQVPALPTRSASKGVVLGAMRNTSALLFGGAVFAGAFSLAVPWWLGVVIGGGLLLTIWWYLQRRYRADGRLILREMAGRRGRVASTLLGLSVGVAGLALVSLTTGAAGRLLEVQLGESAEGNLLIGDPTSRHGDAVVEILQSAEGVMSFSQVTTYRGVLTRVNGQPVDMLDRPGGAESNDLRENSNVEFSERGIPLGLTERVSLDELPDYSMRSGRPLQPGDEGQNRIMVRESFITEELGLETGDRLMFLFENGLGEEDDVLLQFRIVGIISRQSEQTGLEEFGNLSVLPPGVLPDSVRPEAIATIAMIEESDDRYMDRVLVALAEVPGVVAFELSALTQLAQSLLDQLQAIPTLVAWLALVAGTAIIANTVALTTQERRRQIGVMKAIGIKGHRILTMLIIENGLIGLFAGLVGVGVGFIVTVILVLSGPSPGELHEMLDYLAMVWLVLMSIGVALGATLLSAWSAAAEKPMSVLRYE